MVDVCRRELAQRAPFSDYTIPRHSLIRARRAASMLRRLFGELALEQLARPLYTVSADLLSSRMVVHRTGSIVDTVGASMAIPGLAPPVSRESQLLVDGGVLNNLPVDVMVADESGPVIAVDVMRRLDAADVDVAQGPLLPTIVETLAGNRARQCRASRVESRARPRAHRTGGARRVASRLPEPRPGRRRGEAGRREGFRRGR